jgi:hypothetical protein
MARAFTRVLPWALTGLVLGWITALTIVLSAQPGPETSMTIGSNGVAILDWQKLLNTFLGAAGIVGVILVFVNQRLTAREASKATIRAEQAQGVAALVNTLTTRLERTEDRADAQVKELLELKFRYEEQLDKLEQEKDLLKQEYDTLRQDRHRVANEAHEAALQHERERGEWLLRIQELEHSLSEANTKITALEKCVGTPGSGAQP